MSEGVNIRDMSVLLYSPDGESGGLHGEIKALAREVLLVREPREALFVYARHQPDILMVDAAGPDAPELEAVQSLRAVNPSLVAVVVCDEGEALRKAVGVRARGYVVRPFEPGQPARVLGECAFEVRTRRKNREQRRLTDELLNSLPHPALLIERGSNAVVLANEEARHLGFKTGEPCGGLFFPEGMMPSLAIESLYYRPMHLGTVKAAKREWDVTLAPATVNTVLLFTVDVTERGRLERLRQDVERMVRHDLKTPLSGILGMAQVMLEEGELSADNRRFAKLICKNSLKLLHMIEESFSLIRMEEGVYEIKPEPFDFMSMLKGVVGDLGRQASAKALAVRVTVNGKVPSPGASLTYVGEPMHLATCFSNLIKNALEASPPGREVVVDVRENPDLEVDIHNPGAVPSEVRNIFFERYATSGKPGGTGIGTYSARLIARSHGGDITFATSDSEGTNVLVRLPRTGQ